MESLLKYIENVTTDLKQIVFPNICPACHKNSVSKENTFCFDCILMLPYTDHFEIENNQVAKHFYGRVQFKTAGALLYFRENSPVQHLIHQLKYKSNQNVGHVLGKIAGEKLLSSVLFHGIDFTIPVPLHPSKEYQRGYNQSTVFGKGIYESSGIPIYSEILKKIKKTESQTGKSRTGRVENVKESIVLTNPEIVKGKNILLLDDVITTGATLESCALVLAKGQPKSISILTIAVAV